MSEIAKGTSDAAPPREKGVKIFTYPKIIFIFPTLIMSLVCWFGMLMTGDKVDAPSSLKAVTTVEKTEAPSAEDASKTETTTVVNNRTTGNAKASGDYEDFKSPQNMLAVLFMFVLLVNLFILAIDFPRFTVIGGLLLLTTILFLVLWLATYFDLITPLKYLLSGIYLAANAQFYFFFSLALLLIYGTIFVYRWLDYWEIQPNEILHHHGPWSDLERFPTMNLKFDKEIPDIFEHFMFGSGRLVLHVANERRAIILDNVLRINQKEELLKRLMSRLNVRVSTDDEVTT